MLNRYQTGPLYAENEGSDSPPPQNPPPATTPETPPPAPRYVTQEEHDELKARVERETARFRKALRRSRESVQPETTPDTPVAPEPPVSQGSTPKKRSDIAGILSVLPRKR